MAFLAGSKVKILHWVILDLGAMAMKRYSALLGSYHQIVKCHIQDTHWGFLLLCRDVVGVFCGPSWLGSAEKEYKIKHDWVGKTIQKELCKRLKFDHTIEWYLHEQESIQENETHKIIWDFAIQTDHLILDRRPDPAFSNKKRKELVI